MGRGLREPDSLEARWLWRFVWEVSWFPQISCMQIGLSRLGWRSWASIERSYSWIFGIAYQIYVVERGFREPVVVSYG